RRTGVVVEGAGVRYRAGPGHVVGDRAGTGDNVAGPHPVIGDGAGVGGDVGQIGAAVADDAGVVEVVLHGAAHGNRDAATGVVGDAADGGNQLAAACYRHHASVGEQALQRIGGS